MSTKRIVATLVSLIVALVVLGMSFYIFKNVSSASQAALEEEAIQTVAPKEDKVKTNTVKAHIIENRRLAGGLSAQGRLRAYDKTDLIAEIPGMLKPVNKRFKIGTRYQQGEVIFEVDDTEARLNLQAQKAQLQTGITQMMPDLKIDMPESYNQWKNYLDQFNLNSSLRTFPKALSEREGYYVSLKGLHAQYYTIKSGERRLEKYQVKAPFNGIITNVNVGDSGYLRAGSPLGSIMNTSKYEMEASLPISELKYIKRGSTVRVISDDTGQSWRGTIKRIGDMIDPSSQAATVYIGLSGKGLREGQYLRAEIKSGGGDKAATIPKAAMKNGYVYLIKDQQLQKEKVDIAKIEGDQVYVRGLSDGSRIAVGTQLESMVGQTVSIIQ